MSTNENLTLLIVEKDAANLAGKRRLTGDFTEATEFAEEIDGQVYALEPIEPAPHNPVPAINHVRSLDPLTGLPGKAPGGAPAGDSGTADRGTVGTDAPVRFSSMAGLASIRGGMGFPGGDAA